MKTYNCLFCGEEAKWGRSKKNKYCGNKCQGEWEYYNTHIPLILEGKKGADAPCLRRYVKETHGDCCNECGMGSEWNNKPITLQLDHKDGNSDNNLPENLRLLCPNCHSQTETYGSKGQGSRYKKITKRNGYLQEYKGRLV